MEAGATQLIAVILRPENLAVVVGVWILISTLRKSLPFFETPVGVRLLPVLPLILCTGALWLPGAAQAEMGIGDKLLLGLLLGFAVGHVHKLVAQAGMGKDQRIKPQ